MEEGLESGEWGRFDGDGFLGEHEDDRVCSASKIRGEYLLWFLQARGYPG